MPVMVLCPNPDCDASYSLNPADLGKGLRCKKCGWPLEGEGAPPTRKTRPAFGHGMASQPPRKDAYIGTTFANRYEIRECLGRGGMGAVYLAWDTQLDRNVALKFPLIEEDPDGEILKRFQREARAAAKLHHPNICPVHDVGVADGQPFLTMAYIEGDSLAEHVKQGKAPLDPVKAVRIVRVVARALQQAHEAGIIHRDLKPGNIMLSREGRPVVMDFGLARRDDLAESLRTRTGQIMGTPAYMPLEQFQGDVRAMGPGCDIYSLGVILFQLLTGRLPYPGTPYSVLEQLMRPEPPPSASALRPGLDPALEAICRKAMAKRVGDRYATMAAFAAALDVWLDRQGGGRGIPRSPALSASPPPQPSPTRGEGETLAPSPLVGEGWGGGFQEAPRPLDGPEGGGPALAGRTSGRAGTRPARAGPTRIRSFIALGLLGLLPLLGIIIYVVTDRGTVKITGADPPIEVRIDGRRIEIKDPAGETIRLRVGDHELEVMRGDFRVKTQAFQIERGRETVLDVTYTPPVEVARNDPPPSRPAEESARPTDPAPPPEPEPVPPTEVPKPERMEPAKKEKLADRTKTDTTPPAPPRAASFGGTRAGEERSDNELKMVFCWCPPGSFSMGSPPSEPDRFVNEEQKSVTLTRGFWMGQFEVTQAQYQKVMGQNPSYFSASGEGKSRVAGQDTARFPVEQVSWNDAVEFCKKLTEQERRAGRLPDGWEYRLPTEAQWEYACRAGTATATAFGDKLSSRQANFDGNYPYNGAETGPYLQRTTQVGSYSPNGWGLHDLHGNIWEWCQDGYQDKLPGGADPFVAPARASSRVLRGGCWVFDGGGCRSACRSRVTPEDRIQIFGLRLAAVQSE